MNPNPKEVRDQTVRDAKTNLILDSALKVFSEKGYHETRLEDVAVAAGFSKASLYNYYEDKEEIFLNILIRMHEKILDVLRNEIREDRHIKENIMVMLHSILRIYGENFSFSMSMADLKTMAPGSIEKFQQRHQQLTTRFRQYTKEMIELSASVFSIGRKRGEITTPLDDKTLSQYVTSLVRGVMVDCKNAGKIGDIDAHVQDIMEFLIRGLGFTSPTK